MEGEEVQVFKYMFIATLGIWDGWVTSAHNHLATGETESHSPDKRGRHANRPKKMTEGKLATVHEHINKYPRIPSHYTRARSKREYVETGLKYSENGTAL